MAELKPVVEARLKGAEKITQVVEDEVMTSLGRVLPLPYASVRARMAEDSVESKWLNSSRGRCEAQKGR